MQKKIFVIDNDVHIQFAFSKVLEKEGCQCYTATSNSEACLQITEKKPDALFIDISCRYPEIKDMLDQHKKGELDVPLFIITSLCTDELKEWCKKNNVVDILEKPVSVNTIRKALKKLDLTKQTDHSSK